MASHSVHDATHHDCDGRLSIVNIQCATSGDEFHWVWGAFLPELFHHIPRKVLAILHPRAQRPLVRHHQFHRHALHFGNLRQLLTMGPIIGKNLKPTPLLGFLDEFAPRHGYKMIRQGMFWEFWHEESRRVFVIHEADTPDEKCITCRVVKNIHAHRNELRQRLI
jgi:hypothetical protein